MKKITIVAFVLLSVQLFSQTQSLAYRIPFSENTQIQSDSLSSEKSSNKFPSIKKIVFQEIGGVGMGAIGSLCGGAIGALINQPTTEGPSFGILIGAFAGFALGNAAGVYWVGNTREVEGSFGYTLLGSCTGVIAGFYLASSTRSVVPFFVLPGVGGIIAFYLSAEEVVPTKTEALIQIQNEKIQFGTPRIFLTRIDDTSNKLRYNFELLRVNF